jgi:hypothetical protein
LFYIFNFIVHLKKNPAKLGRTLFSEFCLAPAIWLNQRYKLVLNRWKIVNFIRN